MHTTRPPRAPARRAPRRAVAAVALALAFVAACGGSETTEVTLSTDPGGTTPTSAPTPDGPTTVGPQFCDAAQRLAVAGGELDDDPDAVLAAIDDLAAAAPPSLDEPVATVRASIAGVAGIEAEGPEAMVAITDLLLDPDVAEALAEVNAVSVAECDVDLNDPGSVDG